MRSVLRGALILCALSNALPASADVFVNEIHYDDADTPTTGDTNEAIEIVATGGEDLSLYSIVLYNGASPAAAVVYDTDPVPSGSVVSCAGGGSAKIAVINYPLNGVQNGANDAIALVQGSTVIQFLSYEGVATASGGPAAGMTSVDIGVSEIGSTVEGTSLQLGGGPSSTYGGFGWNGSATATMGACNNGQSFGAPVDNPPQLTSSAPANGASNVPVTTEIDLQFSEAVTVNPAGITLTCGASPQTFTSSGSGNAYTITPDAALPYGSSCTLNIGATAVQDVDGTPNPMAGAATISFSTVVDNAPTLSTSTPAHNSTTFPANANLQLTFSEPVAVGSTWFNIVCATSGTRGVADTVVSGGPTSFTINPNVDFVQGESCTLNLVAAQITDLDGNLDSYAGTTAIAFTPAAPVANQLPVVLSTTPMNGDANFPPAGDLVVLFSEPVTLAPGAFALSCTTSTGIALVHASSGASFTIDTGTVLASGDTCTFTIDRTKVTDGEGANPAAGTTVNFTVSNGSAGAYYAQVNTTGGPEQLRCSLHEIIDGHTVYPYSAGTTDTWDILELADQAPGLGNENMVLDAYKNEL